MSVELTPSTMTTSYYAYPNNYESYDPTQRQLSARFTLQ